MPGRGPYGIPGAAWQVAQQCVTEQWAVPVAAEPQVEDELCMEASLAVTN